jgi:hypothetical protein
MDSEYLESIAKVALEAAEAFVGKQNKKADSTSHSQGQTLNAFYQNSSKTYVSLYPMLSGPDGTPPCLTPAGLPPNDEETVG